MKKFISLILCIVLAVVALGVMSVAADTPADTGAEQCDATVKGIQSSTDGTSLRIVGEIANLASYNEVGFTLTYKAEEKSVAASYVFNHLTETDEAGETKVVLTAAENCYLYAFIVEEIPATAMTLSVAPYTVSTEGVRTLGGAQTLTKTGDGSFDFFANHTHALAESVLHATDGEIPVWFCAACGGLFLDAEGEREVPEVHAQCATDKIVTKLTAAETYVVAVYNPNDTEGDFSVAESVGWKTVASGKAAPRAWTLFTLPYTAAAQGNNYIYYGGASIDPEANGWNIRVFGYLNSGAVASAVKNVTDAVAALPLGSLTPADEAAVINARTLYNALSDYAKTQVPAETLDALTTAEAEIVAAKEKAAADAVTTLVDALTDESTAEEVIAAKNAYDQLTKAQKGYVTSETVTKLNAQIARVEEQVIAAAVAAFKAKVDALGTPMYPRDVEAINALAAEYATLAENVQARLGDTKTKLDAYTAEAAKYTQLDVVFRSDSIASKCSGYDEYYLVIYNPTDADLAFYYAGSVDWNGAGHTTLKAGAYTQIVYRTDFAEAGGAYLYGGGQTIDFTGNSETWAGWTCKVYGYTSGTPTLRVALSVNGTTDDPTHGKVLSGNVTDGFFSAFGYMTTAQLKALAAYEDVHFYIYNPSDVDVYFFFQDDKNWAAHDRTLLKAGEWTKVSLSAVLTSLPEGANGVYVDVEKSTEGIVLDGWKITDFYGTK